MEYLKRFWAWFSNIFRKQKPIGKTAIGCVSLLIILCICSIPIAIFSPTTSSPGTTSTPIREVEIPTTQSVENTEVPTNTPLPTSTPLPTNTRAPTSTPIPTETPDPNLILPGSYIVGADIKPGIYRGDAGEGFLGSCYWERLKDFTGNLDSILANSNSIGQFYVEVKANDYAFQTDCQLIWLETMPEPKEEYPKVLAPGTYLVGIDIQHGTYRGNAGTDFSDSCYWARLRAVTGDLESILANDNAIGQFHIQVLSSDFALDTACELEWIGD